jgi:hypothetical protein
MKWPFKLFGIGDLVTVHIAFDEKGEVIGVYSNGQRLKAEAESKKAVQSWIVDLPEAGPTTWVREEEKKP